MPDERDFEWSAVAEDRVGDFIDDGIYDERFSGAIADDILGYLLPIVKDALAAEYDRGYETALEMEVKPAKAVAWERGVAEGIRYGQASVQTNTYYDESRIKKPVNPYRGNDDE